MKVGRSKEKLSESICTDTNSRIPHWGEIKNTWMK